jgi:hypothetical protein
MRAAARRMVMAGLVFSGDRRLYKPGNAIAADVPQLGTRRHSQCRRHFVAAAACRRRVSGYRVRRGTARFCTMLPPVGDGTTSTAPKASGGRRQFNFRQVLYDRSRRIFAPLASESPRCLALSSRCAHSGGSWALGSGNVLGRRRDGRAYISQSNGWVFCVVALLRATIRRRAATALETARDPAERRAVLWLWVAGALFFAVAVGVELFVSRWMPDSWRQTLVKTFHVRRVYRNYGP